MDDFFKNLRNPESALNVEQVSNPMPPKKEETVAPPSKEEEKNNIKNIDTDGIINIEEINEKFDEIADIKAKAALEELRKQSKSSLGSKIKVVAHNREEDIVRDPIKRIETDDIVHLDEINERFNDLAEQKKRESSKSSDALAGRSYNLIERLKASFSFLSKNNEVEPGEKRKK